jgi:predicted DNA-binding protein (MmcQ/YjbR family)
VNLESLRTYCLSKPAVTEDTPFDEETLVFRVGGKIFLFTGFDNADPFHFSVKNTPEQVIALQEQYAAIVPAWHLNKQHWFRVLCDSSLSDTHLKELIDVSYSLIFNSLPVKVRKEITEQSAS